MNPAQTAPPSRKRRVAVSVLLMIAAMMIATPAAEAGARRFTYVYETTTQPKGAWEYEQWITWKTHKDSDPDFDRFDFRHEIEYGVTDRFQLALYADWRYQDGASVDDDGADWRDIAVEAIYRLMDPTADKFGLAIYGEVKVGDELFELEGKLLLQKNVDNVVFAYNAIIEAEWEGPGYDEEKKGKFEQAAGVSYQINPSIMVGAELLHEIEFEEWKHTGEHVVYAGPNASYRHGRWWVTVTPLFQLTSVAGEPDYQTRMIFGVDF